MLECSFQSDSLLWMELYVSVVTEGQICKNIKHIFAYSSPRFKNVQSDSFLCHRRPPLSFYRHNEKLINSVVSFCTSMRQDRFLRLWSQIQIIIKLVILACFNEHDFFALKQDWTVWLDFYVEIYTAELWPLGHCVTWAESEVFQRNLKDAISSRCF